MAYTNHWTYERILRNIDIARWNAVNAWRNGDEDRMIGATAIADGFTDLALFLVWCDEQMGSEEDYSDGDDSTYCPAFGCYPIPNFGG